MKKSYSLSTLLLLMVIVALVMSQIVMNWRLSEANEELELNRRRFGHIRVDDASKTYVSLIPEPNASNFTSYRIRVPEGSRYLLHLTDMNYAKAGLPENPEATKSISLNSWRDGADVILSYQVYWENNAPRLVVHTESRRFFNYVPPDWSSQGQSQSSHLETDPQNAYSTEETIVFYWWRDSVSNRGLLLWLEPHSKWNARRLAKVASERSKQKKEPEN